MPTFDEVATAFEMADRRERARVVEMEAFIAGVLGRRKRIRELTARAQESKSFRAVLSSASQSPEVYAEWGEIANAIDAAQDELGTFIDGWDRVHHGDEEARSDE